MKKIDLMCWCLERKSSPKFLCAHSPLFLLHHRTVAQVRVQAAAKSTVAMTPSHHQSGDTMKVTDGTETHYAEGTLVKLLWPKMGPLNSDAYHSNIVLKYFLTVGSAETTELLPLRSVGRLSSAVVVD